MFKERLDWRWLAASASSLLLIAIFSAAQYTSISKVSTLEAVRESGVFTIERFTLLDRADGGVTRVPRTLDLSLVKQLLGSAEQDSVFGPFRTQAAHLVITRENVARVTLLEAGPQLVSYMTGNAGCSRDIGYWVGDDAPLFADFGEARLSIRPLSNNAVVRELSQSPVGPIVLRCIGDAWFASPRTAVVPARPDQGHIFRQVTANIGLGGESADDLGRESIVLTMAADSLQREVNSQFAWINFLAPIAAAVQVAVSLSLGILLGSVGLRDVQIKRSLGAQIPDIFASFMRSMSVSLIPTASFAAAFCIWKLPGFGLGYATSYAISVIGLLAAGCVSMGFGFFFIAIRGIDRNLVVRTSATSSGAGTRIAGLAMALVLAVLSPFGVYAFLAYENVRSISSADNGFSAAGIWVARAASAQGVQGFPSANSVSARLNASGANATLICNEPWLDSITNDIDDASGVIIFATASFATVLRLRLEGQDLDLANTRASKASLIQYATDQELKHARLISSPVGRFFGFLIGSTSPQERFTVVMPYSATECGLTPAFAMRATSEAEALALFQQIQGEFPEFALGSLTHLPELIDTERGKLIAIRDAAVTSVIAALMLLAASAALVSATFVRAFRRVLAIRLALGELPARTAFVVTARSTKWAIIGMAIGGVLAGALLHITQSTFSLVDALRLTVAAIVVPASGFVALIATYVTAYYLVHSLRVVSLLKEE